MLFPVSRRIALSPKWTRNLLWRQARAVPSLDLRFAENKSLVDATTGSNLVTFTRASSGTFVGSDGLIKTATTNLTLRSQEFANAVWTKTGSSITSDAVSAPDGTLTADKLVEDSSTGTHSIIEATATSYTSGVAYTFSFFVKKSERQTVRVLMHPNPFPGTVAQRTAAFNSNTGAFVSVGSAYTSSSVTAFSDGWYRVSLASTADATSTGNFDIALCSDDAGTTSYTGNGTSGIYIWGAQLEQSSTVGEYIPTTSTINSAPRFDHNPTTGESLGLLVEEQRTNLVLQSNGFDTTWTNTASTETAAQGIAPDGTNTAWALTNDTSNANHNIFQSVSFSAVATTFSIYAKYSTHRWIGVRLGATGSQFFGSWDLQNGVVGSATAGATIGIQSVGNGWYRLTLTATLTSAGNANFIIGLNNADAVALTTYVGTGTTAFIWGAQLEAGAFPTSYIPTTTATVTRSADVASISGSNFSGWYNNTEGTVFSDLKLRTLGTSGFPRIIAFVQADPNSSNQFAINTRNLGSVDDGKFFGTVGDGTVFGDFQPPTGSPAFSAKIALSAKQDDGAFAVAGYPVFSDNTLNMPSPVELRLFGQARFQSNSSGWMKRLTYWPTRLGNEVLQTITQ
jgi:hypothetical protein